jgi:hypothetical protein
MSPRTNRRFGCPRGAWVRLRTQICVRVPGPRAVQSAHRFENRYDGSKLRHAHGGAGANLGVEILEPGEDGRFYASYVVGPRARAVTVELARDAKLGGVAIER